MQGCKARSGAPEPSIFARVKAGTFNGTFSKARVVAAKNQQAPAFLQR